MNRFHCLAAALLLVPLNSAVAQQEEQMTAAQPMISGYSADFLSALQVTQDHYVGMAQALPQSLYGWRPAADAQSIGEILLRVSEINFAGPVAENASSADYSPAGFDQTLTDKDAIVRQLKKSFESLRKTIAAQAEAAATAPEATGFPSSDGSHAALLGLYGQLQDHLGQLVAYGRVNGVVAPWSAP